MAAEIATALKTKMTELALAPYADGRFEVFVNDDRVYSKLETGEFPDDKTITAKIKKRM